MLFRVPIERRTLHPTGLRRERQEQVFMEEHGGSAPRMVFMVFSALGDLPGFAVRASQKAILSFERRQSQEDLS